VLVINRALGSLDLQFFQFEPVAAPVSSFPSKQLNSVILLKAWRKAELAFTIFYITRILF
jgi:hypothetical protein